jgi:hypothetical protein
VAALTFRRTPDRDAELLRLVGEVVLDAGARSRVARSRVTSCRRITTIRAHLPDFNRLNEMTTTARQLYDAMLALYPDRVNPGSLWRAADTATKQP